MAKTNQYLLEGMIMHDLTEWQIQTPDESENPLIEYLQEMERKRHESRKYLEAQISNSQLLIKDGQND